MKKTAIHFLTAILCLCAVSCNKPSAGFDPDDVSFKCAQYEIVLTNSTFDGPASADCFELFTFTVDGYNFDANAFYEGIGKDMAGSFCVRGFTCPTDKTPVSGCIAFHSVPNLPASQDEYDIDLGVTLYVKVINGDDNAVLNHKVARKSLKDRFGKDKLNYILQSNNIAEYWFNEASTIGLELDNVTGCWSFYGDHTVQYGGQES